MGEEKCIELLKGKCSEKNLKKLMGLNNPKLHSFIAKYTELCNPDSVYVCNDSGKDKQYIRNKVLENGEETKLATEGHSVHFDGCNDQARDKTNTKYLLAKGTDLGDALNATDKESNSLLL